MRTITFLSSLPTNYIPLRGSRFNFAIPKFKNHVTIFSTNETIYIANTTYKTSAKLTDLWYGGASGTLVYIQSDNILVSKGIVLDSETLDIMMVTLIPNKYIKFDNHGIIQNILCSTRLGYLDSCLEIYVSQNFVRSKAFNKLLPLIGNIKLIILPHTELKKLHV
jgi:hypothetical protein